MKRRFFTINSLIILCVVLSFWIRNRRWDPKINAAVVFLVGPERKDLDDFNLSLGLFSKFAQILKSYPIIVFHEGGEISLKEEELISSSEFTIRFSYIKLGPRLGFDPLTPLWSNNTKRGGLSYFNMIRWNVLGLFEHPEISNLDYVMRLDSDSEIKSIIKEDLFAIMARRRLLYAYKIDSFESKDFGVTNGLASFTRSYIKTHSIIPKNSENIRNLPYDGSMPAFYNNFEIVSVPFLTSRLVWSFIKTIDASDMIYRMRWGDAPIRYLIMSIFAEPEKIWKVSTDLFQYCHAPLCG